MTQAEHGTGPGPGPGRKAPPVSQWESPDQQEPAPPSASRSARRPALIAVAGVLVVGAVVGVLKLSGAFEGDGAEGPDPAATSVPGATPGTTASPEPTPEETEIPGVTIGTPENPYEPGDSFVILDDWTMTIGEVDTDTWPDLEPHFLETRPHKMDQYQPEPGMVYVSAPSSVAYSGAPKNQDRLESISVYHLATDGTITSTNTCGDLGLAVEPYWPYKANEEPLIEGVPCVEIPPTQVPGGQWQIFVDWIEPDGQGNYVLVHYTAT
jgi:hypothetical protein